MAARPADLNPWSLASLSPPGTEPDEVCAAWHEAGHLAVLLQTEAPLHPSLIRGDIPLAFIRRSGLGWVGLTRVDDSAWPAMTRAMTYCAGVASEDVLRHGFGFGSTWRSHLTDNARKDPRGDAALLLALVGPGHSAARSAAFADAAEFVSTHQERISALAWRILVGDPSKPPHEICWWSARAIWDGRDADPEAWALGRREDLVDA